MALFDTLRDALAMRATAREIRRHPVLLAALARSSAAFDNTGLRECSHETKEAMSEDLLKRIYDIVVSDNQISACRVHFATAAITMAKYQVLVLPPAPESDPTGLRGTEGVSGELKPFLLEIATKNKEIKELMYGVTTKPTYEEVWDMNPA